MKSVEDLLAECVTHGIHISMEGEGHLKLDAPRESLKPEVIEKIRRHKEAILSLMNGKTISIALRDKIRYAMSERANSIYRGGKINWSKIAIIEQKIKNTSSLEELLKAVAEFENTVANN